MLQNIDLLVQETMESYYEYVLKIEGGCLIIANAFENMDVQIGIQGVQTFSEGLSWLLEAESLLQMQSYQIASPISQIAVLFEKINDALEAHKYQEVGFLFKEEMQPLFKKASEWKFSKIMS